MTLFFIISAVILGNHGHYDSKKRFEFSAGAENELMAAKSPTGTAAENSSPNDEDNSETLREAFMKQISGDPQFREAKKSGKAYVIGGADHK